MRRVLMPCFAALALTACGNADAPQETVNAELETTPGSSETPEDARYVKILEGPDLAKVIEICESPLSGPHMKGTAEVPPMCKPGTTPKMIRVRVGVLKKDMKTLAPLLSVDGKEFDLPLYYSRRGDNKKC